MTNIALGTIRRMQKQWGGWHTRDDDGEANQGEYGPEVIPPEQTLPETDDNPGNGDYSRDDVEGQGAICSAKGSSARTG